MEQMNLKLITLIGRKHHNNEYNNIIIEIDGNGYKQLKEFGNKYWF